MSRIVLEGVTKRYGSTVALDNASLTIESGSFTSIFGPPSSGKSVLLRLLLGLETVDAGRILIDGADVTDALPKERNLSMVFQNLALFPHLTARENIAFPLVQRGTDSQTIDDRLDQVAGILSISHILHKKPAALSGGERQRVAIGRALVRDASAYLMDEPIAALDARLRDVMRVELKRLQSEFGHTFIYVTHDNEEAMSVADRMAILRDGRIEQIDAPDAIYAKPATAYVASLVGSPAINLLNAQVTGDGVVSPLGKLPVAAKGRDELKSVGTLRLGIRPEAVQIIPMGTGRGIAAKVSDVERLGAFSIITTQADDTAITAIAAGDARISIGDSVGLRFDASDCHFFDGSSGRRVV